MRALPTNNRTKQFGVNANKGHISIPTPACTRSLFLRGGFFFSPSNTNRADWTIREIAVPSHGLCAERKSIFGRFAHLTRVRLFIYLFNYCFFVRVEQERALPAPEAIRAYIYAHPWPRNLFYPFSERLTIIRFVGISDGNVFICFNVYFYGRTE